MAESRIERLRPHWKAVALATLVALVGIWVAKSNYTSLQLAATPEDFVEELDGQVGRAILAGAFDLVFALGYGTLGLIGLRVHARDRAIAVWAVLAVVVGVAADEVENVLVIANAAQHANLHEKMVDAMSLFGMVKWVAQLGLVSLAVMMALNWTADRRQRADG